MRLGGATCIWVELVGAGWSCLGLGELVGARGAVWGWRELFQVLLIGIFNSALNFRPQLYKSCLIMSDLSDFFGFCWMMSDLSDY